MADNTAEIEQLKKVVNGAMTSITVDGQTVHYSISNARKRLRELIADDDVQGAAAKKRPRSSSIWLGG